MKIICALFLSFLVTFTYAEEHPPAMLVLDGSGSMWGQIDGVAKVTIAQEVIEKLLDELPEEQQLGLTAYGHRIKGNCADIETLVEAGLDNRAAIITAVNGINPKGKTPISDALLISADALSYTKQAATVILVTDGLETCDRDPCQLARGLENAGVDFTAHVVGFGVAEADLPKLECIANETGGLLLNPQNASELAEALTSVAIATPPLPEYQAKPLRGQFEAYDKNGLIFGPLEWTLFKADGEVVVENYMRNQLLTDLVSGQAYRVVARKKTGEEAELEFVPKGEGLTFSRTLRFTSE